MATRFISDGTRLRIVGLLVGLSGLAAPRSARADEPFVDRPLTLPPLHFSADAGIGFGQGVGPGAPVSLASNGAVVTTETSVKLGWGANLEAAVGLPFLGELGVRIGVRFGDDGIDAGWRLGADHFARLFDPVVAEPGVSAVTNPELRLRGTVFDLKIVELGLETRAIIPTDGASDFELVPGVPVRIHIPSFARIDTGIWLPIEFNSDASFTVDVPAALFFQAGQAFFGPVTGVRFNHPGGQDDSSVDVPAGIAGGYTLGGLLDLKVQVRTERINDASWSKFIGGGFGAGLRLP
jgi:hypothetical protein